VRCAQRTRAELAETGPRHPIVSRLEFPLATPKETFRRKEQSFSDKPNQTPHVCRSCVRDLCAPTPLMHKM
jgi:hypothetical protein